MIPWFCNCYHNQQWTQSTDTIPQAGAKKDTEDTSSYIWTKKLASFQKLDAYVKAEIKFKKGL